MCNQVACMQRWKPGTWDTLIMPEGSPSRRVHIKHVGITGEGQPVHLDSITHVLPTNTSWQEEFPEESNATQGIHVFSCSHAHNDSEKNCKSSQNQDICSFV